MKKWTMVVVLMIAGFQAQAQHVDQIIFREKLYDFGEIEEIKGDVSHEFVFTNTAAGAVKILSVEASCGCTTPGWSQAPVAQGATGFVKASFDPKGRPGYFNKTLTVMTDLEVNPIVLQIKGQVITRSPEAVSEYSVANGSLHFKNKSVSFGTVYINRPPVEKQYSVINLGTVPVKFISVAMPSYIKVECRQFLSRSKAEL